MCMDFGDLDLDIGNNDFFGNLESTEGSNKKQSTTASQNATDTTQKLSSISKQALQALEKDDILPLPENFEAYFEKTLLQEQDEGIREKIKAMVDSAHNDTRLIALEKAFNDNFATLRNILEHLLTLCKQMSAMESNTNKRLAEISTITNPLGVQNALKVLVNEIRGFHKEFVTQADIISRAYRDMHAQSSIAKSGATYDTTLGVHTRSFLIHALELECKNGKDFPRHCALVVFAPAKELASQLNEQSKLVIAFKNIAKVVSKNVGSKDIVSYLGGGRFGALLKNVQAEGAIALCEEVIKKCKGTNIFIGDTELQLHIVMGGVVLDIEKTPDVMLQEAKEQLQKTFEEDKSLQFAAVQEKPQAKEGDDFEIPGDDLGDLSDFDLS